LAEVARARGDLISARQWIDRALRIEPSDAEAQGIKRQLR
jgi:hypothetical protein